MRREEPLWESSFNQTFRKRRFSLLVTILFLGIVVILAIFLLSKKEPLPLPSGPWTSETAGWWLRVEGEMIRIGRVQSSSSIVIPNNANGCRIYQRDDLAKARPQKLNLLGTNRLEWIREAAGPSPEYRVVFVPDKNTANTKKPDGSGWRPPWE